jgi:hypothetical protein
MLSNKFVKFKPIPFSSFGDTNLYANTANKPNLTEHATFSLQASRDFLLRPNQLMLQKSKRLQNQSTHRNTRWDVCEKWCNDRFLRAGLKKWHRLRPSATTFSWHWGSRTQLLDVPVYYRGTVSVYHINHELFKADQ